MHVLYLICSYPINKKTGSMLATFFWVQTPVLTLFMFHSFTLAFVNGTSVVIETLKIS